MNIRSIAILAALCAPVPALAQGSEVCIDQRTRQIDQRQTQAWRQMVQAADRQAMQAMQGVWYGEIWSHATNQVDYRYQSFSADGQFQYQSKTCSSTMCSDYSGHGLFAAR